VAALGVVKEPTGGALVFTFGLADHKPTAFAALARQLDAPVGLGRAIVVRARANQPLRISVQLRAVDPVTDLRWRRSVYLDREVRTIVLPVANLGGVRRDVGTKRRGDASSLLFVIDRVNTTGGTTGAVWFQHVSLVGGRPD
jgi:hypothetical protein